MMWHNTNKIAIDIGGSGIRWVTMTGGRQSLLRNGPIDSMNSLVQMIRLSFRDGNVGGIALSIPGFVNSEKGEVLFCRSAPWLKGNLRGAMQREFPNATIHIVNDGEAHALSLLKDPRTRLGAINVSIGSAIGFGVLDIHGKPIRSASGTNWDIGEFKITTRSDNQAIWWAVGTNGLRELEERVYSGKQREAYNHFGYRVAILLSQLAVIFRPNTIGLSGGIISNGWSAMEETVRTNFIRPPELNPQIIKSNFEEAAIAGLFTLLERRV
ncbi:MAG: ROK family protein [Anaerolineaceae bacterium]|jgi:predicted NBD/HSP70 family sugar kinase